MKADKKNWSSFWMDDAFDIEFKSKETNTIDYTKLAATQRAIANFVNIVTGKQIPVKFQGNSSYTDGETVTIGTKLDGVNFDPAVGLALHEGSHIAFTDFDMLKSNTYRLKDSKLAAIAILHDSANADLLENDYMVIKDLLNWIEDRRIDLLIYKTAPGYRVYYEAMYDKYFNDKVIDDALQKRIKNQETVDDYLFHVINFTNPNRDLATLSKLTDIWNLINLKDIQRLKSTSDSALLAIQVYKVIKTAVGEAKSQTEEQTEPPTNKIPGSGNESGDESGDGMESAEGESVSSNDDNGSDLNGDADADDDIDDVNDNDSQSNKLDAKAQRQLERLEKIIKQQKDFINGDTKKTGRMTKTDSAIVNAIRESGTEARTVKIENKYGAIVESTTFVIKKLTSSIICSLPNLFQNGAANDINGTINREGSFYRRIEQRHDAVMRGIQLGKQLGNKLQLRNSDRSLKTTRLQTGKIDRRLVAQLGFNNDNVFHRIVTDRYKNYFIHISIDASGSMDSNNKFAQSLTSAVAIAQAASMTTGIRVQISIRGTSDSISGTRHDQCVTVYAYDSAHDKMSKIKNYFKYLDTYGCTPEGVSFKSIQSDIQKDAKGDEIIFINYSDGMPSEVSGINYNSIDYTRKVINEFKAMGIGIISYFVESYAGYDSVLDKFKYMYGQDSQFINPENMTEISKTINSKFLEVAIN
jgi:hypothetical protein